MSKLYANYGSPICNLQTNVCTIFSTVEAKSIDISDEIEIGQKKIIQATRFKNWLGVADHDNGANDTYYSGFSNAS